MNAFSTMSLIWDKFTTDITLMSILKGLTDEQIEENSLTEGFELADLELEDNFFNDKIKQTALSESEYRESNLDFISMYFSNTSTTGNFFANRGYLYIDIYAEDWDNAERIRNAIVNIMHKEFDELRAAYS